MRLHLLLLFLATALGALLPRDILMEKFPLKTLINLSFVDKSFYEKIQQHFIHSHLSLAFKLARDYNLMEFLAEFNDELNEEIFCRLQENNIALRCIEILGSLWDFILPRVQNIEFIDKYRPKVESVVMKLTKLVPLFVISQSGCFLGLRTGIVLARSGFAPLLSQYLPILIHSNIFLSKTDYSLFACQLAREIHVTQLLSSKRIFDLFQDLTDGEFMYVLLERKVDLSRNLSTLLESKLVSGQSLHPERALAICLNNITTHQLADYFTMLIDILRHNDYAVIRKKFNLERVDLDLAIDANTAFVSDLILTSATRGDIPFVLWNLIEYDIAMSPHLFCLPRLVGLLTERISQDCGKPEIVKRQIALLMLITYYLPQSDSRSREASKDHVEQVSEIMRVKFGVAINPIGISQLINYRIVCTVMKSDQDKIIYLEDEEGNRSEVFLGAMRALMDYHPLISSCLIFSSEPYLHVKSVGCSLVLAKVFGYYYYGQNPKEICSGNWQQLSHLFVNNN